MSRPGAFNYPVDPTLIDELYEDWFGAVLDHPGQWLSVRWELYAALLGITDPPWWVYHPVTVDNPPEARPRFDGPTRLAWEYLDLFTADPNPTGGPLHRVWPYLLVTAAAAWQLLRHPIESARGLLGLLAVASLLYNAVWFVAGLDAQYRFVYPNVVVGVVVGVAWAGLAWSDRRSRGSAREALEDEEVVEPELEPTASHQLEARSLEQ